MLEPTNLLLEFVLSLLVPFLTTGSLTDPALARRAAVETIAAYNAAGQDQLVTIAQLVTFALAALDTLRLSMPQDLSLSMKLKLRGNANALNRTSQHATATLAGQRRAIAPPERDAAEILASLKAAKTAVQQALAAEPAEPNQPNADESNASQPQATDRQLDLAWAAAMTDVAAEYTAELPHLTAAQQQAHLARINALSEISALLTAGKAPSRKARLLGGTTLGG